MHFPYLYTYVYTAKENGKRVKLMNETIEK